MRVIGIDPGLATIGYGVVENKGNDIGLVDYGVILTPAGMRLSERLSIIDEAIGALIGKFVPDAVAFEELFFNKNVKTAITVAQARGVAVVAAYRTCKELYEYTPLQVKQAVTGYGRAEKEQVQMMVKLILGLREIPKPDDAADALAVAIGHLNSRVFAPEFRF